MKTQGSHEKHLRELFQRLARTAVTGTTILGVGCAAETEMASSFEPICSTEPIQVRLLDPDSPGDADGVEVWQVYTFVEYSTECGSDVVSTTIRTRLHEGAGSPCLRAPDRQACLDTVQDRLKAGPTGTVVVETIGERIETHAGLEAIVRWMGAPDSLEDATLLTVTQTELGITCGLPPQPPEGSGGRPTPAGWEIIATEDRDDCAHRRVLVQVDHAGALAKEPGPWLNPGCGDCGRRPAGLHPEVVRGAPDETARYLAASAHLEAASVPAFLELAADLGRLGAPPELVRSARRAAHDEVRHATVMARLAERAGAEVAPAVVSASAPRDLMTLMLDNAVSGCVVETWAAMLATWQATHTTDRALAIAMAVIAQDETRHAALAWEIADWADKQLGPEERDRIARVRTEALDALASAPAAALCADSLLRLGLPGRVEAYGLFAAFRAGLAYRDIT